MSSFLRIAGYDRQMETGPKTRDVRAFRRKVGSDSGDPNRATGRCGLLAEARNGSFRGPNDFNDLQPPKRNRSFPLAAKSFRFRCFSASPRPKAKRPVVAQPPCGANDERSIIARSAPARTRRSKAAAACPWMARRRPGTSKEGRPRRLMPLADEAKKVAKLRKRAAKALKSLARVTLCAGRRVGPGCEGASPMAKPSVTGGEPPRSKRPGSPRSAHCPG